MNGNRINARVDTATQQQLDELTLSTGQTVSHVVREAIAVYHAQVKKERPLPNKLLAMIGRGRSTDGRTDVSANYKALVADIIAAKHGLPSAQRKGKARR